MHGEWKGFGPAGEKPGEKVPARVAKKAKARRVPKKRAVLAAFERATGSKAKKAGKRPVPPQFR